MDDSYEGFSTRAVHAGSPTRSAGAPVVTPIYPSTTFYSAPPGEGEVLYTRYGNGPNHRLLEQRIASLEGAEDPAQRAVWEALVRRGRTSRAELAEDTGLGREAVTAVLAHFYLKRVAAVHVDGTVSPLSAFLQE